MPTGTPKAKSGRRLASYVYAFDDEHDVTPLAAGTLESDLPAWARTLLKDNPKAWASDEDEDNDE